MKLKISLLLIILFSITVLSVNTFFVTKSGSNQQLTTPLSSDTIYSREWTTLAERAQKANASGIKKVIFPAPIAIPYHVDGLSDALKSQKAIVVQPVEQQSFPVEEEDIITWYRLKVIDDLSPETQLNASNPIETYPKEIIRFFSPVAENEILLAQAGGTVTIDGITLTQATDDFPFLLMGKRYLVFISNQSSKNIGQLNLGPHGVLEITEDNFLNPLNARDSAIGRDIQVSYGRSLVRLKAGMNRNQIEK